MEIALFIAIASIGFLTILTTLTNSASQSLVSQARDTMTHLAQERMDIVRGSGFDFVFDYQNTNETSIDGYSSYTRRTRVFYLNSTLTDSTSTISEHIRITISISHPEYSTVNLSSIITSLEGVE